MSLANDLMAVDVEGEGDTLEVGIPQRLFQLASDPTFQQRNPFDVTADGERFLVNALVEDSTPITWVFNWNYRFIDEPKCSFSLQAIHPRSGLRPPTNRGRGHFCRDGGVLVFMRWWRACAK